MNRFLAIARHPLGQAVLLMVGAWILIRFGIPYLPPLVGIPSAPVPSSVVMQYLLLVLVGVLLYVSDDEDRWRAFRAPIHAALVEPDKRWVRAAFLAGVPMLIGLAVFQRARPTVDVPVSLRSIHPAPPARITYRGRSIELTGLENPLRGSGDAAEHLATGRRVYYQNCLPCHGDLLNGQGHFGHGFSPTPLSFTDPGTIAQLTESFVFWRIAKGGPGLPREGAPWNSAMPAWEDFLTEDEVWAVIIFLYEQSGWQPRRWEAHGEEAGGHE